MDTPRLSIRFEELFPCDVVVEQGEIGKFVGELLDGEADGLGDVSRTRARQFCAGRTFARRALRQLGLPETAILQESNGAPRWPCSVVGSISHISWYCVVALAHRSHYRSIGVDIETDRGFDDDELSLVGTDPELAQARLLSVTPPGGFANLLFSAKEATFKCLSPLVGIGEFDPRDLFLALQPDMSAFAAYSSKQVDRGRFNFPLVTVNFSYDQSFIGTAAVCT